MIRSSAASPQQPAAVIEAEPEEELSGEEIEFLLFGYGVQTIDHVHALHHGRLPASEAARLRAAMRQREEITVPKTMEQRVRELRRYVSTEEVEAEAFYKEYAAMTNVPDNHMTNVPDDQEPVRESDYDLDAIERGLRRGAEVERHYREQAAAEERRQAERVRREQQEAETQTLTNRTRTTSLPRLETPSRQPARPGRPCCFLQGSAR